MVVYGCSREVAIALNGGDLLDGDGTRAKSYATQRRNAKFRGIAWAITFPEWCRVWAESGKEVQRGSQRGDQYQMTRFGDAGPYRVGNVSIQTKSQNAADSNRNYFRRGALSGMRATDKAGA